MDLHKLFKNSTEDKPEIEGEAQEWVVHLN
jgi:hypothetical protein